MNKKILAFAVAFTVSTSYAGAVDDSYSVEQYKQDTDRSILVCQIKYHIYVSAQQSGQAPGEKGDYEACITEKSADADQKYSAALVHVEDAMRRERFSAYHKLLISALNAIRPAANEQKADHVLRQNAVQKELGESWRRVVVE